MVPFKTTIVELELDPSVQAQAGSQTLPRQQQPGVPRDAGTVYLPASVHRSQAKRKPEMIVSMTFSE